YILYWRRRFREQPITDFCSVIRINSTAPLEEQDSYFLLCDVLPEDRVLREELQAQRLSHRRMEVLKVSLMAAYRSNLHRTAGRSHSH
ncbi:zinc finger protein 277-like, partial [Myotis lucifugus]|uniref:zinc finger protein 277-like n=1 Tax=Myotis lucifugus TaxID=59463 RepID=UPI000CCC5359